MNLLQLKYFCHVAQTGSVTKSARALFISQPALSRAIAALARELPGAAASVQQGLPEQPFSAVAERSERLSLRQRVGIS